MSRLILSALAVMLFAAGSDAARYAAWSVEGETVYQNATAPGGCPTCPGSTFGSGYMGLNSPCCEYEPNFFDHMWDDYCCKKQLRGYHRHCRGCMPCAPCVPCRPACSACGPRQPCFSGDDCGCSGVMTMPAPAPVESAPPEPVPAAEQFDAIEAKAEIHGRGIMNAIAPPQSMEIPLLPEPPTRDRSADLGPLKIRPLLVQPVSSRSEG